jgi:hypothetical protein
MRRPRGAELALPAIIGRAEMIPPTGAECGYNRDQPAGSEQSLAGDPGKVLLLDAGGERPGGVALEAESPVSADELLH